LSNGRWQLAANIAVAMDRSGIGVPQIMPRLNADWQQRHAPPERGSDHESGVKSPPDESVHAPPPPGTGGIIDKSV
jgi:hypothetical protein